MPGSFVFLIILLISSIIAFPIHRRYKRERLRMEARQEVNRGDLEDAIFGDRVVSGVFYGLLAMFVIVLLFAVFVIVPTKEIGVVTTFGKPTGALSNGLHLKAPWQKVTTFDAAIQTDNHEGARKDNDTGIDPGKCTQVRIGNQSTACLDNSIRWRIMKPAADQLYRDYRSFDNVRQSLVTRQLTAALNTVFANYDPLNKLDVNKAKPTDELNTLAAAVQKQLKGEIGKQIEVLSVIIPLARFNNSTESKINLFQAALADTRIAAQKVKTATNDATANSKLSASVSHDPNVLVSKCLDTLNDIVKNNQTIPAGFSCWPGGQSAVVVPSAKAK